MKKIILLTVIALLSRVGMLSAQTISGDPFTIQALFSSIGVSYVVKPSIGEGGNIGTLTAQGLEPEGFPGTYFIVFINNTGALANLGITLACNDIYVLPPESSIYYIATNNGPDTDSVVCGSGNDGPFTLDTSREVQIRSDGGLIKFWGEDGSAYLLYVEQLESQNGGYALALSPVPFNASHPPMPPM